MLIDRYNDINIDENDFEEFGDFEDYYKLKENEEEELDFNQPE